MSNTVSATEKKNVKTISRDSNTLIQWSEVFSLKTKNPVL